MGVSPLWLVLIYLTELVMRVNSLFNFAAVVALCLPLCAVQANDGCYGGCGASYGGSQGYASDCGSGCGWLHCNRAPTYGYAASLWDGYCATPFCQREQLNLNQKIE